MIYLALSGGRKKRRVILQPLEEKSYLTAARRVTWRPPKEGELSGGRKIDRFIRKKGCQISFKYELNIQNVKDKNEQFYKLANDYVRYHR